MKFGEDSRVIICSLASWPGPKITGTKLDFCAECGESIIIAPTGQKELEKPNTVSVCVPCGLPYLEKHELLPLSKEQLTELYDNMNKL